MNEKKCIYHYTHPIEENAIGSGVRPYMLSLIHISEPTRPY